MNDFGVTVLGQAATVYMNGSKVPIQKAKKRSGEGVSVGFVVGDLVDQTATQPKPSRSRARRAYVAVSTVNRVAGKGSKKSSSSNQAGDDAFFTPAIPPALGDVGPPSPPKQPVTRTRGAPLAAKPTRRAGVQFGEEVKPSRRAAATAAADAGFPSADEIAAAIGAAAPERQEYRRSAAPASARRHQPPPPQVRRAPARPQSAPVQRARRASHDASAAAAAAQRRQSARACGNKTRVNPKSRIPAAPEQWNMSTAYRPPVSVLWQLTVPQSAEQPRAPSRTHAAPRGKRFAGAHIARGGSHSVEQEEQLRRAKKEAAERKRRQHYEQLVATLAAQSTTTARSRAEARSDKRLENKMAGKARTRRRPASAATTRAATVRTAQQGKPQRITRPAPFDFTLNQRLGSRGYSASYGVHNPDEACALKFDFPDVPRRSTELEARRLVPYKNYDPHDQVHVGPETASAPAAAAASASHAGTAARGSQRRLSTHSEHKAADS